MFPKRSLLRQHRLKVCVIGWRELPHIDRSSSIHYRFICSQMKIIFSYIPSCKVVLSCSVKISLSYSIRHHCIFEIINTKYLYYLNKRGSPIANRNYLEHHGWLHTNEFNKCHDIYIMYVKGLFRIFVIASLPFIRQIIYAIKNVTHN
jgi:hypothetical protein